MLRIHPSLNTEQWHLMIGVINSSSLLLAFTIWIRSLRRLKINISFEWELISFVPLFLNFCFDLIIVRWLPITTGVDQVLTLFLLEGADFTVLSKRENWLGKRAMIWLVLDWYIFIYETFIETEMFDQTLPLFLITISSSNTSTTCKWNATFLNTIWCKPSVSIELKAGLFQLNAMHQIHIWQLPGFTGSGLRSLSPFTWTEASKRS